MFHVKQPKVVLQLCDAAMLQYKNFKFRSRVRVLLFCVSTYISQENVSRETRGR